MGTLANKEAMREGWFCGNIPGLSLQLSHHEGLCSTCRYLYMNQLTGTVPASLGSLTSLQKLCASLHRHSSIS